MSQRILHVVGRMDRAGAETMLINLYQEIDRSKFQFDFVYFTDDCCDFDAEISSLGGRIIRIPNKNPFLRALKLWKILRQKDWSIVHVHTLFSSGLFLLAAKIAGVPRRIVHAHNTSDENNNSFAGRCYKRSMRWLLSWTPSDYLACGTAAGRYLFPGRRDVHIIPNAIDISRFAGRAHDSFKRPSNGEQNEIVILQVGRLVPVKNHPLSIEIAVALEKAGVNFQMLFVGAGPEKQSIENLIQRYGLEGRVKLLGLRKDISELMKKSNVMLMPSLYEGFPVVLVESQAAGLPAVVSSAISSEVDLGLELVNFVDIDVSPEIWVAKILAATRAEIVAIEVRCQKLEAGGFSARGGAARLASIYGAQ